MTATSRADLGLVRDGRGVVALPIEMLLVDALESGRCVSFVAEGGSMGRGIRPGSAVRVEPCAEPSVAIGDVVARRRNDGGIVLHRVVARCARCSALLTWGDGQPKPDGWTTKKRPETRGREPLLGRVRFVETASFASLAARVVRRVRARAMTCPCTRS